LILSYLKYNSLWIKQGTAHIILPIPRNKSKKNHAKSVEFSTKIQKAQSAGKMGALCAGFNYKAGEWRIQRTS
jgi:hypothetical protein